VIQNVFRIPVGHKVPSYCTCRALRRMVPLHTSAAVLLFTYFTCTHQLLPGNDTVPVSVRRGRDRRSGMCPLLLLHCIAHTAYVDAVCCYWPSRVFCLSVCHTSEPCKNGWTYRDAVWIEDSGGPREPCIRWGPNPPMGRGNFEGVKGRPIVNCRDTAVTCAKNSWTDHDAI